MNIRKEKTEFLEFSTFLGTWLALIVLGIGFSSWIITLVASIYLLFGMFVIFSPKKR